MTTINDSSNNFFGNDHFLSVVYGQYAKILYQYGLKFTKRERLVEDSIQEIFTDLYISNYDSSGIKNMKYFLFKCCKRKLLKNIKKESRFIYEEDSNNHSFEILYLIEQETALKKNTAQKDRLLMKALSKLTSRQREAIYLKFTNGFDYEEISELLGMSIEASRNLIYRAIKALKEHIKDSPDSTLLLMFIDFIYHKLG